MKKMFLLISLMIGLLFLFSSMEIASANITVDYTLPFIWLIIIGGFVFFLALVGWIIIDWLHHRKKK